MYRFSPLTPDDLPLLARWFAAPHVAQWWGDGAAQIERIRRHLAQGDVDCYLVDAHARPLGFLQSYEAYAGALPFPDHPAGARGIDQFIGEPDMIDCGHGSAFIREFVGALFRGGVPRVLTDPDPANARAIRAYWKAGFRADKLYDTPHGRTLLMVCDS